MANDDLDSANTTPSAPSRNKWSRGVIIGGLGAVAVVAAIGLAGAAGGNLIGDYAMNRFGGHVMQAHMGMGFGGHGLANMLDEIDATPEQEDKLWTIIDGAHSELRPAFREFRETRKAVMDILGAPTIDRAALEKLRSERLAAIDAASRKMTTALADAAEVLTPEQRAKLVENVKERHNWHGRW